MKYKRALFVHGHKFVYGPNQKVYSSGQYPYSIWHRYLNHFEHLIVCGRHEFSNNITGLNLSSGENVTHKKLPNLSLIKRRIKTKKEIKSFLKMEIIGVDVVIARLPSAVGILAIKEAKRQNKPYVIEVVGDAFTALWSHGTLLGKVLAPISFLKNRKAIKSAPFVLYVTKFFLQKRYPSKNLVITTHCSNVELFDDVKVCKRKSNNNHFSIGLIGSYTSKYKGIDNALNVVKRLHGKGYNIRLKILGKGDKEALKDKCKSLGILPIVDIEGMLPGGKPVIDWLSRLDLYIQPSLTEGLPRSVIEAMYCGLPCVASNVGGIPELIDENWLHNPRDEKKMFQLIERLYLNEKIRKEQGERNKKASVKYTKTILDSKRFKFWQEVLKEIEKENQ